jgi:predicted short-subunit dehydrogenase-like oxidoreductase (DUF2520 family)
LRLTIGPADEPPPWLAQVAVVILAVPDDAIPPLAHMLGASGRVHAEQVVLHLSGSRGHEVLQSLAASGAGLGSLHPLQTLVEPDRAPLHLRGAWAAVEGMPRAVETAERLARAVGLRPFRVRAQDKARYHAGAVFASNYFVVVEWVAEQLLRQAGLSEAEAWAALRPLVRGTLDNLVREGPLQGLTGPVLRGDSETVARHLAVLPEEVARLYRELGGTALDLARRRGLDEASVARVAQTLSTGSPPSRPGEERT